MVFLILFLFFFIKRVFLINTVLDKSLALILGQTIILDKFKAWLTMDIYIYKGPTRGRFIMSDTDAERPNFTF